MAFATENKPAKKKYILRKAFFILRRKYPKMRRLRIWKNRWGTYGESYSIPELLNGIICWVKVILIAKGSKLYRGRISTQKDILGPAQYNRVPILLAWESPDFPKIKFYLFDAEWILSEENDVNIVRGKTMVNYTFSLGEEWDIDEESLQIALERLETRKKNARDQSEKTKKRKVTLEDFFSSETN